MNAPGSRFEFGPDLAGRTSRLMFYVLLAIILMSLDFRERWVDQARASAGLVTEPLMLLIEWPYQTGARLGEGLRAHRQLLAEARALRLDLARVSADLLVLEELQRENAELRELVDAGQRVDIVSVAAEIRRVDLNPFSHRVLINRGRRDGLVSGQPVVDTRGLVGQLDEVFLHSARVILLTDPDHALPVRIERTGLRTIAYGSGLNAQLRLTDLPMNVDLEPGDIVLTSGLGGVFPAGLPVARVGSVERPVGEAFARAELRPLGRPDRSRYLLVLDRVSGPEDAQELTEELQEALREELLEEQPSTDEDPADSAPTEPDELDEEFDEPAAAAPAPDPSGQQS